MNLRNKDNRESQKITAIEYKRKNNMVFLLYGINNSLETSALKFRCLDKEKVSYTVENESKIDEI